MCDATAVRLSSIIRYYTACTVVIASDLDRSAILSFVTRLIYIYSKAYINVNYKYTGARRASCSAAHSTALAWNLRTSVYHDASSARDTSIQSNAECDAASGRWINHELYIYGIYNDPTLVQRQEATGQATTTGGWRHGWRRYMMTGMSILYHSSCVVDVVWRRKV